MKTSGPNLLLGIMVVLFAGELAEAQTMPSLEVSLSAETPLDLTYTTVGKFKEGSVTVHLLEQDGRLKLKEKTKTSENLEEMEYAKVIQVAMLPDTIENNAPKRLVTIKDSTGGFLVIVLPGESSARTLAVRVAEKASLEFIGDAWRTRKSFTCPKENPSGCRDFKDLFDHDDAEIVSGFYDTDKDNFNYACFDKFQSQFFLLHFSHSPFLKVGRFTKQTFKDGQSADFDFDGVGWEGEFGEIRKLGKTPKPQIVGSIDSSALSFRKTFTNRVNTTTSYSLDVRWSTGRFTENFEWKDGKGNPDSSDASGVCVKMN